MRNNLFNLHVQSWDYDLFPNQKTDNKHINIELIINITTMIYNIAELFHQVKLSSLSLWDVLLSVSTKRFEEPSVKSSAEQIPVQ